MRRSLDHRINLLRIKHAKTKEMSRVPPGFRLHLVYDFVEFILPERYSKLIYLGRGSQGDTCTAWDSVQQTIVTIKRLRLPDEENDRQVFKRAYRELMCMMKLKHENIVTFYNAFTSHSRHEKLTDFYIVRECMRSTMNDIVRADLGHTELAVITFEILSGLRHLQKYNIAHRDLKPSNVLITHDETVGDTFIKLCDFGQSNRYDLFMRTPYVCDRHYRAPEILLHSTTNAQSYTASVDVWSVGCILGQMILGRVVFDGTQRHKDQWKRICCALGTPSESFFRSLDLKDDDVEYLMDIQYPGKSFEEIFPNEAFPPPCQADPERCALARDFLSKMLVIDPAHRITVNQAMCHPYILPILDTEEMAPDVAVDANVSRIHEFTNHFDADTYRMMIFQALTEHAKNFNIFTGVVNIPPVPRRD